MPSYDDRSKNASSNRSEDEGAIYDSCDEEDIWLGLTGEDPQASERSQSINGAIDVDARCTSCGCAMQWLQLVPCSLTGEGLCESCSRMDQQNPPSECRCPICTQTTAYFVLRMVVKL